jgi:simple sugar transport system permease protein
MVLALLIEILNFDFWLALAASLLVAAAVGVTNATLVLWVGIPSFIVTLGMNIFLTGIEVTTHGGLPLPVYDHQKQLIPFGGYIGNSPFSMPTLWFIAIGVIALYVLHQTRLGNWIFASGGNAESARAVGVPVNRTKAISFVACSVLAGLTGIMQLGYILQWNPGEGADLPLNAIMIAVLGGTSLFGGIGTIGGTMIASVFAASMANGLILAGAPSGWYTSFIGVILVVAVVINLRVHAAGGGGFGRIFRRRR